MIQQLGITPVNRSFSGEICPPTDRLVLPRRFTWDEFNGETMEQFIIAWQFQVMTGFAMTLRYIFDDELARFIARLGNLLDGRAVAIYVECMAPTPITLEDVAGTLAPYLVNARGHDVAMIHTRDLLQRTMLPFLGDLTQMKTALAFSDFERANEIATRVDPKRRW
jgi:hypothetical protein